MGRFDDSTHPPVPGEAVVLMTCTDKDNGYAGANASQSVVLFFQSMRVYGSICVRLLTDPNTSRRFIMRRALIASLVMIGVSVATAAADTAPSSSHGIAYPDGWQNWSAIAVSHRTDNNTIRVILGNDIALKAARTGTTNPWPDGAILAKVVWKDTQLPHWETATVPGAFVHAEFMFRESEKYAQTHGWGWARWVGTELKPFNEGPQVCISCHTPVESRNWVYTEPAQFPGLK